MTNLDRVIDGAGDKTLSTGDLLRRVLVVAHGMQSDELLEWAQSELSGYGTRDLHEYPGYRGPIEVSVRANLLGPFHSQRQTYLNKENVPDERGFREAHFYVYFNQPLAELERLAAAEGDLVQPWPSAAVQQFNQWGDENKALHLPGHHADNISKIIQKSLLDGIIDTVRTRALMFALELRRSIPEAGEFQGPTTDTPRVREIVTINITNQIYGGTNTLANGENITQSVHINRGDAKSLRTFLDGQGFDEVAQAELQTAIEEDGDRPGSGVRKFLEKLGNGTLKVGADVATPTAIALSKAALSGFFGVPIG